jgi:hypothetical protein
VSTRPPEPPPGEGQPSVDPAADERRCPRCTAPYEPLQEYCLECGQRLVPLPSESYTRTVVWSRESPVWLWIALLALLLVALAAGAIVALAATDDDGSPAAASSSGDVVTVLPPPTGPITVEPPTTLDSTISIPTFPTTSTVFPSTTFSTTTFPTSSTTTTTGGGTIMSWPSGTDGFTVVLKSTPVADGRGPAESAGQQAINNGLPEVGILSSSNFSTLNPGYYVTFTGVYDTQDEAENALPRARSSGFPTAYVREVAD